jgi:hypothetical protein
VIVENESNWETRDLEHLLECVLGMDELQPLNFINDETLLLFQTKRGKIKKDWSLDPAQNTPAANETYPIGWNNTILVKIHTAKVLRMPVLDALAHVEGSCQQDMSARNIELLARCIGDAVGGYSARHLDYKWARMKSMRVAAIRNRKSKTGIRRQILALEDKQRRIMNQARREVRDADAKISKLKARL